MIIRVTKNDIKKARKLEDSFIDIGRVCPIALSLTRRGFEKVVVSNTTAKAKGKKKIHLPTIATVFIRQFDDSCNVRPITFSLDW